MNQYKDLRKIGEGNFSTVYVGRRNSLSYNNSKVEVIKMVRVSLGQSAPAVAALKSSLRELALFRSIGFHENIVDFYDCFADQGCICFRMEWLDTDLDKLLLKLDYALPLQVVARISNDFFSGLAYLHSLRMIHRDIKPGNLLFSSVAGICKIADFGLARGLDSEENLETFGSREVCTRWYKAVEVIIGSSKHSMAMDIWSAGCVLAELFNHGPLFPGVSDINQLFLIYSALGKPNEFARPFIMESPVETNWRTLVPRADNTGVEVLQGCFKYDPQQRATAKDLLKHDFFKQNICRRELALLISDQLSRSTYDRSAYFLIQYECN